MQTLGTHRLCTYRRRRGGMTFVELLISISLSSLVVMAIASLQYVSGRALKEVYNETRTRSSRMIALDQIRFRLSNARPDSVAISNSNRTILFKDPNLSGGPTSMFYFLADQRTLYYQQDLSKPGTAKAVVKGPINITFQRIAPGATVPVPLIRLTVKSASPTAHGEIDTQDGMMNVLLRNRY